MLSQRPLGIEGDPAQDFRGDLVLRHAFDAHERRAGGHEVAERGKDPEHDVSLAGQLTRRSGSMCTSTPDAERP